MNTREGSTAELQCIADQILQYQLDLRGIPTDKRSTLSRSASSACFRAVISVISASRATRSWNRLLLDTDSMLQESPPEAADPRCSRRETPPACSQNAGSPLGLLPESVRSRHRRPILGRVLLEQQTIVGLRLP